MTMQYDDGSSGLRRLSEAERLKLHAAMETEEVEDVEISHEVSPPPPVAGEQASQPASSTNRGLAQLATFLYSRDLCEADPITNEATFV